MATASSLVKDIESGRFKPAYYFFGSEDYRLTEAIKYVVGRYLPDRHRDMNLRRLDGARTSLADLTAELATVPMLGDKLAVVVSNFQSYKPTEIKKILKMLDPPDTSRVVIFSSPSQKSPKPKSAFVKTLIQAKIEIVEFKRLTQREVIGLVKSRLVKAGLSIDSDALTLLSEMISGSRGGLETELSKLTNFMSEGTQISVDDIRQVCSGYEVYNVFDLAELMIEGNAASVLKMLSGLLTDGNSPILIMSLLQSHFISLFLVKGGKKPIGNRDWMANRFRSQASGYSDVQIEQIICDLAAADADLRRSQLKPETILEQLALSMCRIRN